MSEKTKMTFVVPENLQHDLRERVIKDGYGLRGKSIWVSEALANLFEIPNFPELVHFNEEMKGFGKAETIVIDYAMKLSLEKAILVIRKEFPALEGVKSCMVRTAIIQRLLRK